MNVQTQALLISRQVNVGFDPSSLIAVLLPILAQCFRRTEPEAVSPQEFLADHYDETTGTFDLSIINRCRPQTRRAAREQGRTRLGREALDQITFATLEQARTAPPDVVDAVMAECVSE